MEHLTRSQNPSFVHAPWISVFIDPDPSGGPGFVRIVEASGSEGVVLIPLKGEEVGMVRILRRPIGRFSLELPRGFGDGPGDVRDQAIRELSEETGIQLTAKSLIDLGAFASNGGISSSFTRVFVAPIPLDASTTSPADTNEIESFTWMSIDKVLGGIDTGVIWDGFTLAALLKAAVRGIINVGNNRP